MPVETKADELKNIVVEGFATLRADLSLVSNELSVVKGRLGVVEERVNAVDERRKANSDRVREVSSSALEQATELAKEITARESLALEVESLKKLNVTQLVILQRLDGIVKKPMVGRIATAIGTALLLWLGKHFNFIP